MLMLPVVILSNRNTPAVIVTPLIDVKDRMFVIVVLPLMVFVFEVFPNVIPPLVFVVYKLIALLTV